MKEETHSLKCVYKGVQPYIKVTAYELSAVNCSADKMSGYYGEEGVLISDDPAPGYNFKDWSVTGTTLTGNNFKFNGDVTAQANYSAIKYNVTLQNDGHGSIAASKTTGNIGDTITLSNTPATHYHFDHYATTGATLTGNAFNIETSNVTAKGFFAEDSKYNLTLQTDGHGKIGAGKTTGYAGDTTTLSNTASAGYTFNNYTVTGCSINGSTITFQSQNCTAKANYQQITTGNFTASGTFQAVGYNVQTKMRTLAFTGTMGSGNVFMYNTDIASPNTFCFKSGIRIRNLSAKGSLTFTGSYTRGSCGMYTMGFNKSSYLISNLTRLTGPATITATAANQASTISTSQIGPYATYTNQDYYVTDTMTGYIIMTGQVW